MATTNAIARFNDASVTQLGDMLATKEEMGLSFPADYNYRNELLGAYLTLQETTDKNGKCVLDTCTQQSVASALMRMCRNGVSMQKGQCYPVAYNGKLTCQMSVFGNTCIARRYGLKTISAMCIYEGDTFKYHVEDGEIVIDEHSQNFEDVDTDKIRGAYSVATMYDGYKHIELMNMKMIKRAWQQGYGYRESGNGTHQKFTDQMAEKTVKNRNLKYIIKTFGEPMVSEYVDKHDEENTIEQMQETVDEQIVAEANAVEFVAEESAVTEVAEEVDIVETIPEEELPDFMKG